MTPLLWPVVERQLSRHLSTRQLIPTLGDLTEDFARHHRAVGRLRAEVWLLRECLSLVAAYRAASSGASSPRRFPMGRVHLMEVRLACRRLAKRPGASLASIVTLGCAIGAAAATWSLLSTVLLRPVAVDDPDRLMVVGARYLSRDGTPDRRLSVAHIFPIYPTVRDSDVFDQVAAGGMLQLLVGTDALPQSRAVYFASHSFFETLGVRLAMGRGFRPEDDRVGAPLTAVVSDRLWRATLRGDREALGSTISVSGKPAVVVGVVPPAFRGLDLVQPPDLYLPLHTVIDVGDPYTNFFADGSRRESPTAWVTVLGRLRRDSSASGVAAHLNTLSAARGRTFELVDVNTASIPEAARAGMAQFSRLLGITVGLLLLIGCLTVGMLVLIRSEARRDEFAMCLALGASRGRLAAGIALEGAMLAIAGAALAAPIAWWLLVGIRAFQLPGGVNIEPLELAIDVRVWLAAAVGAGLASLLIALTAGVFGFSARTGDVLRARAGATPRLTRRRTRAALVAAQVAVALVLLAGAGLFGRSLAAALRLNPGFDTTRLASVSVNLGQYGYSAPRAGTFFEDLRTRLAANPTIRAVSATNPMGGMTPSGKIVVDDVPRQFPSLVAYTAVDSTYFSTMGMRILRGRDFSPDDVPGAPPVVIVSESFGRLLANGGDPLGHRIKESSSRPGQPPAVAEVVGVVPDLVTNVTVLEPLVKYYPLAQQPADRFPSRTFVIRAADDATVAARETLSAIKQLDPAVTPSPMLTMEERIARQMGPQQFGVLVLGTLAGIAVLLTFAGTYVLAESMAAVRRREVGIRAALGASRTQLGALVFSETVTLVGIGLVAGLFLTWLGAGTIRAFLFQVEPLDPITLITVAAGILTVALAASLRPALRTAGVDLVRVLRDE